MQNIGAVINSQTVNKVEFSGRRAAEGGISFVETVARAVKFGEIIVPAKADMNKLNFEQNKLVSFDEIKYDEEEEKINAFISRIQRILREDKGDE